MVDKSRETITFSYYWLERFPIEVASWKSSLRIEIHVTVENVNHFENFGNLKCILSMGYSKNLIQFAVHLSHEVWHMREDGVTV